MELFSNDAVTLHTTAMSSAVVLGSITDASIRLGTETIKPATGDVYESAIAVAAQKPALEFGTEAIKSFLTQVGSPTGLCIDSDGTHPGVSLHGQKHDKCATSARVPTGTAEHVKYTVENGLILPQSLSVSGGGNAALKTTAYGISTDGETSPVDLDYTSTRPSGVITSEMFGLGVPRVNGIYLDQVTGVNVQWDHELKMEPYAGSLYPSIVSVLKTKVTVTITTDDPKIVGATPASQIAELGVKGPSNTTYLQFIQRDASGGGYIADATSTHLTAYMNGFITVSDAYKAAGSSTAQADIKIEGLFDSTQSLTSPITWLTTTYDRP